MDNERQTALAILRHMAQCEPEPCYPLFFKDFTHLGEMEGITMNEYKLGFRYAEGMNWVHQGPYGAYSRTRDGVEVTPPPLATKPALQ